MGIIRMGPPEALIKTLADEFHIESFVETGTFRGGTTLWASGLFKKVYTVEFSRALYEGARGRLGLVENIVLVHGDSRVELEKFAGQLDGRTLFWLDAHWCGDESYGNTDQSPLIEEINVIGRLEEPFIMIDDARLFTSPPQPPHKVEQWPDIVAVTDALRSVRSDMYIVVIEDVIIAVPGFAKDTVAGYCQDVNARVWAEYGRLRKESKLSKGMKLILQWALDFTGLRKLRARKNG